MRVASRRSAHRSFEAASRWISQVARTWLPWALVVVIACGCGKSHWLGQYQARVAIVGGEAVQVVTAIDPTIPADGLADGMTGTPVELAGEHDARIVRTYGVPKAAAARTARRRT